MNQTTIIYYTDNCIPEEFAKIIRRKLVEAAEGKPIISVSHKPIELGTNICVGEIGRSHLSIYLQMLAGGKAANTEYIALAEHDCLYTPEHFNWIPPDKNTFWYNINHWYGQWFRNDKHNGEYSYQRRRPLSQLICGREVFLSACEEKVWMLEHGFAIRKGKSGAMEPGQAPPEDAFVPPPAYVAEPGVCDRRQNYLMAIAQFKDLGKEIGQWNARGFATVLPNIDIRHGKNFSGGRRTTNTTFELPYWGRLENVLIGSICNG